MSKKSTYKELEKRVKELENEAAALKRVEKSLKISNSAMESSINAIGITDFGGKLIYVNDSAVKMWGYDSKDEILGRFLPEFWERPDVFNTMKALLEKGGAIGEDIGKRKDGSLFNVQFSASMIKDGAGNPLYMFGSFFDISERKQVEEMLRESEERYRSVFENTGTATAIDEEDMTVSMVNTEFEKLSGYSKQEIEGKIKWTQFIAKEDLGRLKAFHAKRRENDGNSPSEYEFHFVDKQRNIKDILVKTALIPGTKKSISSLVDVTARKKVEEALRESEAKYRELVQNANSIIFRMDTQGNITFFNEFAQSFFGYDEDEIIGKNLIGTIVPKSDSAGRDLAEMIQDLLVHPDQYATNENENMRMNGERVWVVWTNKAIRNKDGNIVEILCVGNDNTERKRAEEAQRESEALFNAFMKHLPALAFMKDADGRYLYFNEACTTFYNVAPSERIGKTDDDLFPSEVAKHLRENDKEVIRTGEVLDTVEKIQIGDEVQYHHISKFPVKKEDGPSLLAGIAIDITDRVRAEEENKKLEAQLQQAQKMEAIGTLAGGIAHDFNNILSAIIGYTELSMLEISQRSSTMDNLNEIIKASHRARDMVKQILAFSRQHQQERIPIQISQIVKEALKMLRGSLPTTIEIRNHIENGIGIVEADATQIHQVLMNLSTNAAQAMGEKGGILKIDLANVNVDPAKAAHHADLRQGSYVRLTVSDTGEGMTQEVLERIFEPYFTTKEKEIGTGMGLAVVHGIVKGHGGEITVQSKPGEGSSLSVYLPRIEKEIRPEAMRTDVLSTGHERILFVDDEQALVDIGRRMLEKLGYKVTTRVSSVEALELFRAKPGQFDLVVTDMTMPNMTGDRLAKELMQIRADIPIVLCTGYSECISKESAKKTGIKEFIMKPLAMKELADAIRNTIDKV